MANNIRERFEEKFKVIEELKNIPDTVTVGTLVKDFFQQELLALAEEVESAGRLRETKEAAALIRSKADELV